MVIVAVHLLDSPGRADEMDLDSSKLGLILSEIDELSGSSFKFIFLQTLAL